MDKQTRRDFLKLSTAMGVGAVVSLYAPSITRVFAEAADEDQTHVIWLQGAGDTGCTISLLQGSGTEESPDLVDAIRTFRLSVDFQPTIMIPAGDPAIKTLEDAAAGIAPLDVLIVEGAIPEGNYCTVGEIGGVPVPVEDWVRVLGEKAKHIVAVGTCAAFGGIPAAMPNPTKCRAVSEVVQKEVLNIPGCPPHPDWMTLTLATVLSGINPSDIDPLGRPKAFFQNKIHENCPLRNRYSDVEKWAEQPSEVGCLYRIGCKGKKTHGDCPVRLWNNGVNFCTAGLWLNDTQVYPSGAPCIGCTEPEFPEHPFSPFYQKLPEQKGGNE